MSEQEACNCPRIDGYVIRSQGCTHPVHHPKPAVTAAPITEPYADVDVDLVCAWSDYRKDYGVPSAHMSVARKSFMAGWLAARAGDQSGALR